MELSLGARPPPQEVEDFEPGWRWGWQHEVASWVERQHREDDILPTLDGSACTLLRSQSGPAVGAALSATPWNPATRNRLCVVQGSALASLAPGSASCLTHLPMWRLLDSLATIAQRAVELECWGGEGSQARIFREAGARVATNVLVRDLLVPNVHDGGAWRLWLKACHCSMGSSWW